MPEERLFDYLNAIDRQIARCTYNVWRLAWRRGLVTDAELTRFLIRHDQETFDLEAS